MSYNIKFTDSTNLDKPDVVVDDNDIERSRTSLQFPGRNVTGYGTIIGENFLHLLENFANDSPPDNPVQGQLWYDNTTGVNQLKINVDGTLNGWQAAGGLKKGNVEPELAISLPGDLWVNTDTQQLYLYSGSGWILVGPRFSSGARTGAEPEFIIDTLNNSQPVVSQYVSGERIAIISKSTFTPKSIITGFDVINEGVTLNANYSTYFGTAEKSKALLVGTTTVAASNFLRGDITSNTNFPINVRNSGGLSVGEDTQLNLSIDGAAGVIFHKTAGSNLDIRMNNNGTINTVIRVDSSERVGINNSNPQADLDVGGDILSSGIIKTTDTTASTSSITGSGVFAGGVGIGGDLNVGGVFKLGSANIDPTLTNTLVVAGSILPDEDNGANIGAETGGYNSATGLYDRPLKFNRVFASRFDGNFYGTVFGNITGNTSGSASKLASSTIFDLTGDVTSNEVEFDGQVGTPSLTTASVINNNDGTVTLTFAAQTVAPYPASTQIIVSNIVPLGYRGTHTVVSSTVSSVTFASTATGPQTTPGIISAVGASSNRKRFISKLSETFIFDKTEIETIANGDEFIISRGAEGLKKISKSNLWNAISRTPVGSVTAFAGPAAPVGWLLCDGSEVLISDYPVLFDVIKFSYKDSSLLAGFGTFALPDLRGRFALGFDNMNNGITVPSKADLITPVQPGAGSANNVTDPRADFDPANPYAARSPSGSENRVLGENQIPDHEHDLIGDAGGEYAAFRAVPGEPDDSDAVSDLGGTTPGRGQYLKTSGGILTDPPGTFEQIPLDVMNPYLAMNFIIYTGQDV